uniref:Uncharacterized protein n=1 Tax=Tanacetum cinerariifolium TaxID=118510 RepID=A0A699IZ12_TANCI|nr:hypothetical protein [Tanacetum cinerariifolium]
MRLEGLPTWDGGKGTWGGRVRVIGTVPVCVRIQERARGEGSRFGGKRCWGVLCELLGFKGLASLVPETQFDLRPYMESDRWTQIHAAIQQHLQKLYNGQKATLKKMYWVPE